MIIIPNVNKENSCLDCPVWSLCWDNKPTEDICKDRCPIVEFEGVELFDDMPTIEAVPIEDYRSMEQTVYKLTQALAEAEPKHGRWKHHQYGNTAGYYECNNCGKINSYESNYCPKCGAKMDEVKE